MGITEQLGLMTAMGKNTIPLLFKVFFFRLRYPKMFAEWKKAPEGYDPKPNYEIPKYEEWMKIPEFDKKEKYLRPTKGCECNAPEIVALAYKLGAHDLPEKEYAENVLKWVKNNIRFNIGGGTAVETLKEGMGTCIQHISLLLALCRARGIKARYKMMVTAELDPRLKELGMEISKALGVDERFGDFASNLLNAFPGHMIAEVYIDEEWLNADPTLSDAVEVGLGYRISKLGDEPEWASEKGKIYYLEDSPRMGRPLLNWGKSFHGLQYVVEKGFGMYEEEGKRIMSGELGGERKKGYEDLGRELQDLMKRVGAPDQEKKI